MTQCGAVTRDETGPLLEAARGAQRVEEYERAALEHVLAHIGADVAMFLRQRRAGAHVVGFDRGLAATISERWTTYSRELSAFTQHAIATGGGVGVDVDYFGHKLERLSFYRDLMYPHRGRSTMLGYLHCGGRVVGQIVLGRRSPGFHPAERECLRRMMPALSVCEMAVQGLARPAPRRALLESLTPREREVVSYLELGYTNAEIALACGTAPRTVRNQLSSVFAKLGASTRAEAVAILLRSRG